MCFYDILSLEYSIVLIFKPFIISIIKSKVSMTIVSREKSKEDFK